MSIFRDCEYYAQHGSHDYDEGVVDGASIVQVCRSCGWIGVNLIEPDLPEDVDPADEDEDDYDPDHGIPEPSNLVKGKYKCPSCKTDFDHIG